MYFMRVCLKHMCPGVSTYWVSESEAHVLHAKVQKLFFLQRAVDVRDHVL